jgi:hypothetical protein
MKLIHRVGYYLGGFSIGLIFLAFFLSGKKTSCSYGLDARVLKDIRQKEMHYSEASQLLLDDKTIDTTTINYILKKGDVNFGESNTKLDSCKTYMIEGKSNSKEYKLLIENCNKKATINSIEIN